MAFNAQQIYPIDFNKSAAVGVDLPFSDPAVFKPNYTTAAAIKNNLINYFLTNPGERYLNPIGGGLRAFIFEQITTDKGQEVQQISGLETIIQHRMAAIQVQKCSIAGWKKRRGADQ